MIEHDQPIQAPEPCLIDRATAEALGYRCMTASEYAQLCSEEALLTELQREGLI